MKQMQAQSLLFLGGALIYFFLGLSVSSFYEYTPSIQTHVVPMAKLQKKNLLLENSREKMRFEKIELRTELDAQQKMTNPKDEFSKTDKKIFLSAEIATPIANEEVECVFYYLGEQASQKPFEVGKKTTKLAKTSNETETVSFELSSPGNEWQLEGNFKAVVRIPSLGVETERLFSIR